MDLLNLRIPIPLVLAIVATVGYLFGRRSRADQSNLVQQSRRELRRAQMVAVELERIARSVQSSLAHHNASLDRFKGRLGKLNEHEQRAAWKELCREAEDILAPTLRLASQIANAYDQIRQQSTHLMAFTELRTDPLTGVSNRRALDDAMAAQLALLQRYRTPFAIAMFDVDHFKKINDENGHLHGDQMLQDVAKLIDDTARETDIVARYGGEEFVVVMPQTGLDGACVFAERMRRSVEQHLPLTVSVGVAAGNETDTTQAMLVRADSALYAAKAAGRNCTFRHTGVAVETILDAEPTAAGT